MSDTLIAWFSNLIGSWTPNANGIDFPWLACALLAIVLVWGIIRIVLALLHIIGGGR